MGEDCGEVIQGRLGRSTGIQHGLQTVDCSEGLYWAKSLTVPLAWSNLEACYALLFLLAALSSFVGASHLRVRDDSFLPDFILRVTTETPSQACQDL